MSDLNGRTFILAFPFTSQDIITGGLASWHLYLPYMLLTQISMAWLTEIDAQTRTVPKLVHNPLSCSTLSHDHLRRALVSIRSNLKPTISQT